MGNIIYSSTRHAFPCQICSTIFQRELSGTLLCRECGINNQFEMMIDPNEKLSCLLSYVTFPLYLIVKEKVPLYHITNDLNYNYNKDIIEIIKSLSHPTEMNTTPIEIRNRYRLIKSILRYLDMTNYLKENNLKGIYIHYSSEKNIDVLFVHVSNIQDYDRILEINLYGLTKKLIRYYENEVI